MRSEQGYSLRNIKSGHIILPQTQASYTFDVTLEKMNQNASKRLVKVSPSNVQFFVHAYYSHIRLPDNQAILIN